MKIALIYLGRRGAGLPISFELTHYLAATDEVLAVLSETAASAVDWSSLGVKTLTVSTYNNLAQAVWSWINQHRIRRLAGQIAGWSPDVMLFPMFYTWNPFIQARLRHIPGVIAVHDPHPHPGLRDKLFQWLENRSIRLAARGLVFSESLKLDLAKRGIEVDKIDTISLGAFNYQNTQNAIQPASHTDRQPIPTLLFFGRITEYKGLEILLSAFQKVTLDHKLQLLIAGDGDLRPYRSLLNNCEGAEIINRWIADEEIPHIFKRADLVVLPYTSASQSGVIPIAASFGLPVIATRTGGIPEQIQHEQNGLLIEPGSIDQLAEAIVRLLDDPSVRQALGQRLKDDFNTKHSWQQTAIIVRDSLNKACLT